MNSQHNSRYHEVYARSIRDPEGFWGEAARAIDWIEPARKRYSIQQCRHSMAAGFSGAVCQHLLERRSIETSQTGRGNQVALIYDSPLSPTVKRTLTYTETAAPRPR